MTRSVATTAAMMRARSAMTAIDALPERTPTPSGRHDRTAVVRFGMTPTSGRSPRAGTAVRGLTVVGDRIPAAAAIAVRAPSVPVDRHRALGPIVETGPSEAAGPIVPVDPLVPVVRIVVVDPSAVVPIVVVDPSAMVPIVVDDPNGLVPIVEDVRSAVAETGAVDPIAADGRRTVARGSDVSGPRTGSRHATTRTHPASNVRLSPKRNCSHESCARCVHAMTTRRSPTTSSVAISTRSRAWN
jgi:hypothetical protein